MIGNSKIVMARRSLHALMVVGFVLVGSTSAFAETDYNEEDVGVADVYIENDIYDPDATYDVGVDSDADVDFDSSYDPDASTDGGSDVDEDVEFDIGSDVDEDVRGDGDAEFGDDTGSAADISEGTDAEQAGVSDAGADFLFVELGVEVQFDGDFPDVVTLGLSGALGEVEPVDVSVTAEGLAVWEIESLQAGTWVLMANAEGYEPIEYRFVAGDSSQMLIRVSMGELGSQAKSEVKSGWACSAVTAEGAPSMLILFAAFAGSLWIQRRRKN